VTRGTTDAETMVTQEGPLMDVAEGVGAGTVQEDSNNAGMGVDGVSVCAVMTGVSEHCAAGNAAARVASRYQHGLSGQHPAVPGAETTQAQRQRFRQRWLGIGGRRAQGNSSSAATAVGKVCQSILW
jgi:hypothetical protein